MATRRRVARDNGGGVGGRGPHFDRQSRGRGSHDGGNHNPIRCRHRRRQVSEGRWAGRTTATKPAKATGPPRRASIPSPPDKTQSTPPRPQGRRSRTLRSNSTAVPRTIMAAITGIRHHTALTQVLRAPGLAIFGSTGQRQPPLTPCWSVLAARWLRKHLSAPLRETQRSSTQLGPCRPLPIAAGEPIARNDGSSNPPSSGVASPGPAAPAPRVIHAGRLTTPHAP